YVVCNAIAEKLLDACPVFRVIVCPVAHWRVKFYSFESLFPNSCSHHIDAVWFRRIESYKTAYSVAVFLVQDRHVIDLLVVTEPRSKLLRIVYVAKEIINIHEVMDIKADSNSVLGHKVFQDIFFASLHKPKPLDVVDKLFCLAANPVDHPFNKID